MQTFRAIPTAMNPTRQALENTFEGLSDAELLSRCGAGTLTEEAQAIAANEARRRGLEPPEPLPPVEDAVAGKKEAYHGDFVIVARNLNLTEAHLYQSLLESAGIPAEVGDTNFSRIYGSTYSANVKVPAAFVAEANEVFAAFKRGDFALDESFDPGDS